MTQHVLIFLILLILNIINEARLDFTHISYYDTPQEKADKYNTKTFCKEARYFLLPWVLFQVLLTIMQIE